METEKTVIVPVSTLGLLMAMAGSTEWKTESTKKVVASIVGLIDEPTTEYELNAYALAFSALEIQACGGDAEEIEIIDITKKMYGDKTLEKALKKIEEIETIRKRRNKK
ncbi:hypothetical protein ACTQ44_09850 [Ligilactobacillus ruminis]|uniref:hypothetical protein n=1 Tax=Ligilactobacillus ruminis TaxID=1623 RepID=UPI003F9900A7